MQNAFYVESSKTTATSSVSAITGQVWYRLQELKEQLTQELLDEGPLCQSEPYEGRDDQALVADSREIEWRHRSQLEGRLRDINDAQDRLLDGKYGKCVECESSAAGRAICERVVMLREFSQAFIGEFTVLAPR